MENLRDYRFGDWFHIFVRAIPALVLATIIIVIPIAALAALAWAFIKIR